ncbi:MAG: RHS repeat domain-containing protein [Fimbriimonadaceae bacterium]
MAASVLYTNFGGMLVHEDRGGVQRTYVHDEMGNTSFLVDATSVTDTYTYTPYGQVTHAGSIVNPFTFIGALGYFATGWSMLTSYVRARWYSNVSGQWGSVDPIWPMEPAYGYVRGNPAMVVDPSGNTPQIGAAFLGCLAGGVFGFIGGKLQGQSNAVSACRAVISCVAGAILGFIATTWPWWAKCLGGALGGLAASLASALCSPPNPCGPRVIWQCLLISALMSLAFGCFAAGNASDLQAGLLKWITGAFGASVGSICSDEFRGRSGLFPPGTMRDW